MGYWRQLYAQFLWPGKDFFYIRWTNWDAKHPQVRHGQVLTAKYSPEPLASFSVDCCCRTPISKAYHHSGYHRTYSEESRDSGLAFAERNSGLVFAERLGILAVEVAARPRNGSCLQWRSYRWWKCTDLLPLGRYPQWCECQRLWISAAQRRRRFCWLGLARSLGRVRLVASRRRSLLLVKSPAVENIAVRQLGCQKSLSCIESTVIEIWYAKVWSFLLV